MNLKPTRNRVIIKYTEVKEKSVGGIILPADENTPQTTGIVVAAGEDDLGEQLNVDDLVLFGKFAGTKMKVQGEDYVIMNYTDILAVLETSN